MPILSPAMQPHAFTPQPQKETAARYRGDFDQSSFCALSQKRHSQGRCEKSQSLHFSRELISNLHGAPSHTILFRGKMSGGYFRSTAGFCGLAKAHAATPLLQTNLSDNYLESLRMEGRTRPQQRKGKTDEQETIKSLPVQQYYIGYFVLLRIARFDLLEFHA